MAEVDVIRRYVRAFSDELDGCSVRHRIGGEPRPWEFVIACGLGWTESKKELVGGRSRVYMGQVSGSALGRVLTETLGHWGKIYGGIEHRSAHPVVKAGEYHLRLEPFDINGPNALAYASKLEELGRDLGRAVADHVVKTSAGAQVKVQTAEMKPQLRRVF